MRRNFFKDNGGKTTLGGKNRVERLHCKSNSIMVNIKCLMEIYKQLEENIKNIQKGQRL